MQQVNKLINLETEKKRKKNIEHIKRDKTPSNLDKQKMH